jgi:GT2 family glycosyltransferase
MNKETVCAVVVTYNRKNLLIECLEGLRKQTRPVDAICLVDNASTDGTPDLLLEKGYIK